MQANGYGVKYMNCLKCNSIVLLGEDILTCLFCGREHVKLNGKLMFYTDYVMSLEVIKTDKVVTGTYREKLIKGGRQ